MIFRVPLNDAMVPAASGTALWAQIFPGLRKPEAAQALSDAGLVPVQLARYLLVLDAVADRAAVRAGGRVATRKPVLYQRPHLWL
jgi:hypothetical protein